MSHYGDRWCPTCEIGWWHNTGGDTCWNCHTTHTTPPPQRLCTQVPWTPRLWAPHDIDAHHGEATVGEGAG